MIKQYSEYWNGWAAEFGWRSRIRESGKLFPSGPKHRLLVKSICLELLKRTFYKEDSRVEIAVWCSITPEILSPPSATWLPARCWKPFGFNWRCGSLLLPCMTPGTQEVPGLGGMSPALLGLMFYPSECCRGKRLLSCGLGLLESPELRETQMLQPRGGGDFCKMTKLSWKGTGGSATAGLLSSGPPCNLQTSSS